MVHRPGSIMPHSSAWAPGTDAAPMRKSASSPTRACASHLMISREPAISTPVVALLRAWASPTPCPARPGGGPSGGAPARSPRSNSIPEGDPVTPRIGPPQQGTVPDQDGVCMAHPVREVRLDPHVVTAAPEGAQDSRRHAALDVREVRRLVGQEGPDEEARALDGLLRIHPVIEEVRQHL